MNSKDLFLYITYLYYIFYIGSRKSTYLVYLCNFLKRYFTKDNFQLQGFY